MSGAPAAGLLGAKGPGVHEVSADGARLSPRSLTLPIRARRPAQAHVTRAQPAVAGELAAACASADLLLTLITLDPSVGGEHLATWAADAVVVVTAGRSSWTKIHAVGEMIRLAGTRLVSAVLVGADKTDESLGVAPTPEAGRECRPDRACRLMRRVPSPGVQEEGRPTTAPYPGCRWVRPRTWTTVGAQADEFVRRRIPHPPHGIRAGARGGA